MSYMLKRTSTLLITFLFIVLLAFFAFRIIPGNPALSILGPEATKAQVAALEKTLGVDRPLGEQFLSWFANLLQFDFGKSLRFGESVLAMIMERLPVTFSLATAAMLITVLVGVPLGVIAARHRGGIADFLISVLSQLGLAIPSFWSGILLILFFGLGLKLFQVSGYVPWSESPFLWMKSLFLPSLAIALPQIAILVRFLRTAIIEQMELDYVRTAHSKGLGERAVMFKHVLKNALIPAITVLGMNYADILAGSIVIEQVFALPGLGRLLINGIATRDYVLVQGMVFLIALVVILVNFLVDVSYRLLNPKIKLK